jgi:microcystin-dependent protein
MNMDAFLSMITAFGCNFVIRNWGACNGTLIPVSQNTALFSLIGTQFGGNGVSSFGLPDLRGRSPVGYGNGPGLSHISIGEKSGQESVTLMQANLPAHSHTLNLTGQTGPASGTLNVSTNAANTSDPDGNYLGVGSGAIQTYSTTLSSPPGTQAAVEVPAQQVQVSGQTLPTGGSLPFDIRNPYLGVNYQICMYGIYPSRS